MVFDPIQTINSINEKIMMENFLMFVKNHWQLWVALVAILAVIIFEEIKKMTGKTKRLSPQEVSILVSHDEAVIVDMRSIEEFKNGHILGAINTEETNIDELAKKLEAHKNKRIVLIHNSENTALNLGNKLAQKELNTYVLAGGINAWKNASLPITKK